MSLVVGFGPDLRGVAGLNLAGQLARSLGTTLVLCCVVHDSWESPTLARGVDADWRNHLESLADEAIARARQELPDDIEVESVVRTGRSVPRVLLAEAKKADASLVVVGSSTEGALGHVALGSVSDRLVHSSPVPVALATRGYRTNDTPVSRLVVAVDAGRHAAPLAQHVAPLAQQFGVPVEAVTFAVRRTTGYPSAIGPRADEAVFTAWREQAEEAHKVFASALRTSKPSVRLAGSHIVEESRWSTAVESFDWGEGDLLVLGSSDNGPIRRVFLGSTAARIVRHAPVPVVVVPRMSATSAR